MLPADALDPETPEPGQPALPPDRSNPLPASADDPHARVLAERTQFEYAFRLITVTAGADFYIETLSENPPKAVFRQVPPSEISGGALGGPHFPGETHGFFLFLPGADRPRLGAPMEERLDWLARKHSERIKTGARTPLGVPQAMLRDATAVYVPFLADQGLPSALAPGLPEDCVSHFVLAGATIGHVVVHFEMVRRGGPGIRLDLAETVAIARGRILRLRAANGQLDGVAAAPGGRPGVGGGVRFGARFSAR